MTINVTELNLAIWSYQNIKVKQYNNEKFQRTFSKFKL